MSSKSVTIESHLFLTTRLSGFLIVYSGMGSGGFFTFLPGGYFPKGSVKEAMNNASEGLHSFELI